MATLTWMQSLGRKLMAMVRLPWAARRLAYWVSLYVVAGPGLTLPEPCSSSKLLIRTITFSTRSYRDKDEGDQNFFQVYLALSRWLHTMERRAPGHAMVKASRQSRVKDMIGRPHFLAC